MNDDCIRQHMLSSKHQLQIGPPTIIELQPYRLTNCLTSYCERDAPKRVDDFRCAS